MISRRGKKALYEVIGKARFKSLYSKPLEQKKKEVVPEKSQIPPEESPKPVIPKWPKKPRMLELINNRIELSIPYTVVIAAGLCLILLFLIFFRLGQYYGMGNPGKETAKVTAGQKSRQTERKNSPAPEGAGVSYQESGRGNKAVSSDTAAEQGGNAGGRNRIVIKQYSNQKDLEQAMKYFNEKGIETQIQERKNGYFLVTKKEMYNNPNRTGSDGYMAIQRIKEIGAEYKAPKGFEQFTFNDPYGEVVE